MCKMVEFNQFRNRMNARIFPGKVNMINRIFILDKRIRKRTDQLFSLFLKWDDLIKHLLGMSFEFGFSEEEVTEIMSTAPWLEETIVIPNPAKGVNYRDELNNNV